MHGHAHTSHAHDRTCFAALLARSVKSSIIYMNYDYLIAVVHIVHRVFTML